MSRSRPPSPNDAFARWDRAHLHEFRLSDGTWLTTPYGDDDELGPSLDVPSCRPRPEASRHQAEEVAFYRPSRIRSRPYSNSST